MPVLIDSDYVDLNDSDIGRVQIEKKSINPSIRSDPISFTIIRLVDKSE
jgi:hypothetical protein